MSDAVSSHAKDEINQQVRKMLNTTTMDVNPSTSGSQVSREPKIDQKEARANEIEEQNKRFRDNRAYNLRKKSIPRVEPDSATKVKLLAKKQGLLNETNTAV